MMDVPLLLEGAIAPRLLQAATAASNCTAVDPVAEMSSGEVAGRIFFSLLLLALSALFSGLTLGLLSLDPTELEIVINAGTPKEKKNAEVILEVRKQGNLLLVVLLLGNASVNSLLSIVLADLTTGVLGFLLSTFLILIFGEAVPQSVCARHALKIGATFVPLVHVFIFLTYPLSKPIAMVFDWALGEEMGLSFSRKELKALLEMHLRSNKLEQTEARVMSSCWTSEARRRGMS
jgi:metal transporter CNNM